MLLYSSLAGGQQQQQQQQQQLQLQWNQLPSSQSRLLHFFTTQTRRLDFIGRCRSTKQMGVLYATAVLGAAAFVLPWLWDNVVIVGRRLWATKDIPEPPGSLWLGHIPALVQSKCRSFRCFHAWGLKWPVYRIRFFLRPVRMSV